MVTVLCPPVPVHLSLRCCHDRCYPASFTFSPDTQVSWKRHGQQHHANWLSKNRLPLKAMLPLFRHLWVPGGGLAAKKKPGNQVQSSVTESLCTTEYVPGASHILHVKSHNCSEVGTVIIPPFYGQGNWASEIAKQPGSNEAGILNLVVLLTLCCLEVYKVINQSYNQDPRVCASV